MGRVVVPHVDVDRRARQVGRPLALVASVVVASIVITAIPASAKRTSTTSVATTKASGRIQYRTYRVGDCATWNESDRLGSLSPSVKVVKCAKPHLVEIAGSIMLARRASFPTPEQWVAIATEGECLAVVERYLGAKLDPFGRFGAGTIHPLADGWSLGHRKVWCTLAPSRRATAGTFEPAVGGVRGQDQTALWEVGTCIRSGPVTAVPCAEEHTNEVVGNVTVTGFTEAPTSEQIVAAVAPECRAIATTYLGGRVPSDVGVGSLVIAPGSWAAGRRLAQCIIGRAAAGAWVAMTGSLRG